MYPEYPPIVTLDFEILDALFGSLFHQMDNYYYMPKSNSNGVFNKPKIEHNKLRPILKVTNKSIFKKSKFQNQITDITLNEEGVAFTSEGNDPYLILPALSLPKKAKVIKIGISVPTNTVLQIFFKTAQTNNYCEKQSVMHKLTSGRNTIYIEIPDDKIIGKLRLDPGNHPGLYVLQKLEFVGYGSSPGPAMQNIKSKLAKLTALMVSGKGNTYDF